MRLKCCLHPSHSMIGILISVSIHHFKVSILSAVLNLKKTCEHKKPPVEEHDQNVDEILDSDSKTNIVCQQINYQTEYYDTFCQSVDYDVMRCPAHGDCQNKPSNTVLFIKK